VENLAPSPTRLQFLDHPALSELLYQLSYPNPLGDEDSVTILASMMYSSSKYTVLIFNTMELNKFLSNYNAHPTDKQSTSNMIWQIVSCIATRYRQDGPGIES
jgi:hypothetical protein